jgi:hypothetical protein
MNEIEDTNPNIERRTKQIKPSMQEQKKHNNTTSKFVTSQEQKQPQITQKQKQTYKSETMKHILV